MSHVIQFVEQASPARYAALQAHAGEPQKLLSMYLSEFDMDSLDYLEFVMELEDFCQVSLNEQDVLKALTLADLDRLIEKARAA